VQKLFGNIAARASTCNVGKVCHLNSDDNVQPCKSASEL
jgi:hypothetical protein